HTVPTERIPVRRHRRGRLPGDQEMELWLGVSPQQGTVFASDEERRAMWFRHRELIMTVQARAGRRPQGWWMYEAPPDLVRRYDFDHEASILYTAALCSEAECAELLRGWRFAFEQARDIRDAAGRRAAYDEADIPKSLVRAWTAEHERRAEMVSGLP